VITSSGSKYFLQEEEKQTGFFGFGGRREESSTPEPKANVSSKKSVVASNNKKDLTANFRQQAEERKRIQEKVADERKRNQAKDAEDRKQIQAKQAQERKRKQEKQALERKQIQEKKLLKQLEIKREKQVAQDKKMREAEAKRKNQAAAASEAKKTAAIKRKEVAEASKKKRPSINMFSKPPEEKIASTQASKIQKKRPTINLFSKPPEKKGAQTQAPKIEKKRPTISLFSKAFENAAPAPNQPPKRKPPSASQKRPTINLFSKPPIKDVVPTPASKNEQPPAGVPVIMSWKKRADGGVSGLIYGSTSFADGEFIETSPIAKGKIENGAVVSTKSKSRYFLSSETAAKKSNMLAAFSDMTSAKKGATITLTRERKENEAQAAIKAIEKAESGATFSLFGLGFGAADEKSSPPQSSVKAAPNKISKQKEKKVSKPVVPPKRVAFGLFGADDGGSSPQQSSAKVTPNKTVKKKPKAVSKPAATSKRVPKPVVAPKGVPTLNNWEPNRDGTITGIISGSDNFEGGERVTTSAIAKGKIMANQVVTTGSGSKYFLA